MRYKAKARVAISQALPLIQHATNNEGTLWNIEQEKELLSVEFTSNLAAERLVSGFETAANILKLSSPVQLTRIR